MEMLTLDANKGDLIDITIVVATRRRPRTS